MKIAVLNGNFFSESQIDAMRKMGEVKVYHNTDTEEEAIERLKDADIAVVDGILTPLNKKVLESTDTLQMAATNVILPDGIDMDTATARGIQVSNTPGYSTDAVAAHVFALLLSVNRKLMSGDAVMRLTPFQADPANAAHYAYMGHSLAGKTLGIVGLGNIGQQVAHLGKAFGMKVIAYNRSEKNINGVTQVPLEQLLKESDVVSLNLPHTRETENLISAERLLMMKPSAILINTGRGKTVDEKALAIALQSGKLAGAGLDTITNWSPSNPLLKLDNVVLTPHIGFFTPEALRRCADIVVQNVKAFVDGKPQNVVNLWQRISFMNLWQNTDKVEEKDLSKDSKPSQNKFDLSA